MFAATVACIAIVWAADEAAAKAPAAPVAQLDTARWLEAIDLAPVLAGVRKPGPTRFGMHYWIDPAAAENPHAVHFVVVAILADAEAARAHYDHLRTRAGHPPLSAAEAAAERFAVRFNADAGATDVTFTRGNVYTAFRANGHPEHLRNLAETLIEALDDPLVATPGAPEPVPVLSLTRRTGPGHQFEIHAHWDRDPGEPLPRVVLFRPDGEYIAMADAEGMAEVEARRFDTIDAFDAVAGWEDNRWHCWRIEADAITEEAGDE